MSFNFKDLMMILATIVIWGCNYAVSKIGLREVPPFALLAVRFLLVGLLLFPFIRGFTTHWKKLLALSFVLGTAHFGLVYLGLTNLDAATTSILVQLQVPIAGVLSFIFLKERPNKFWVIGVSLAFGGTAFILGEPRVSDNLLFAAIVVASAFMWAISYLQLKKMQVPDPIDPFSITGWMSLLAAPQLLILSLVFEPGGIMKFASMSVNAWISFGYQVLFVGILAYILWYRIIAKYPVSMVSPFTLLIPVFSAFAGVILLAEPLTMHMLIGGALTLSGIALVLFSPRLPGIYLGIIRRSK